MRAATPGLLLMLGGCVTASTPEPPLDHSPEYECRADWQTPESRLIVDARLAEDGRLKSWHLTALRLSPNRSLVGWVTQFDFEGPRLPSADDDWSLMLRLDGFARGNRTVRVDLLRGGVDGGDVLILSAPRAWAGAIIPTNWQRNAVRAALAGAPELVVRVTDRRGRMRLSHRIPAAVLDSPTEAVATHRAELEAIVADYRNRCTFVPYSNNTIVIT